MCTTMLTARPQRCVCVRATGRAKGLRAVRTALRVAASSLRFPNHIVEETLTGDVTLT